jgi:Tfp pilus assembly protein PilX
MNMKHINNERGMASLIALIMVAMLTLLGLAALSTSDDEVSIAGNELQETRAFYAAEAGLEKAAAALQSEFDTTGVPPLIMPSGSETINNCAVAYSSSDNGAATQQVLSNGTLAGLHALVKSFTMTSTASNSSYNATVQVSQTFEAALVPIFQFAVFYNNDLEIAPGPAMTLGGRVHTNGDLWLQSDNSLSMDSYVTSAGHVYHGRKGAGSVGTGDVRIKNGSGTYVSMKLGSGWLESTDSYWYDSSVARAGAGRRPRPGILESPLVPYGSRRPAQGYREGKQQH